MCTADQIGFQSLTIYGKVRNPHGKIAEWTGDYSAESPSWTAELRKRTGTILDDPADAGCFWMCFRDFACVFNRVYVCMMVASPLQTLSLVGKWSGQGAGGCSAHPTWRHNPMFTLDVTAPRTRVFVTIAQADLRRRGEHTTYAPIGLLRRVLFVLTTSGVCVLKMPSLTPAVVSGNSEIVGKTSFWPKRETTCEVELDPLAAGESYLVVPSTCAILGIYVSLIILQLRSRYRT